VPAGLQAGLWGVDTAGQVAVPLPGCSMTTSRFRVGSTIGAEISDLWTRRQLQAEWQSSHAGATLFDNILVEEGVWWAETTLR